MSDYTARHWKRLWSRGRDAPATVSGERGHAGHAGTDGRNGGRRWLLAMAPAVVLAGAITVPYRAAAVDADGAFRRAAGVVVYLVVIPAAILRGHPPEHTGQGLHGGPPLDGHHVHHLLVALFDERTGKRITNAAVTATVHGLRHTPEQRIGLEPMAVGGTQAYGGFATLPARDLYRIEIDVRRPDGAAPASVIFPHRHFQP